MRRLEAPIAMRNPIRRFTRWTWHSKRDDFTGLLLGVQDGRATLCLVLARFVKWSLFFIGDPDHPLVAGRPFPARCAHGKIMADSTPPSRVHFVRQLRGPTHPKLLAARSWDRRAPRAAGTRSWPPTDAHQKRENPS